MACAVIEACLIFLAMGSFADAVNERILVGGGGVGVVFVFPCLGMNCG